jgi:hypothetical protein
MPELQIATLEALRLHIPEEATDKVLALIEYAYEKE